MSIHRTALSKKYSPKVHQKLFYKTSLPDIHHKHIIHPNYSFLKFIKMCSINDYITSCNIKQTLLDVT